MGLVGSNPNNEEDYRTKRLIIVLRYNNETIY